jgi:hypothetical protein
MKELSKESLHSLDESDEKNVTADAKLCGNFRCQVQRLYFVSLSKKMYDLLKWPSISSPFIINFVQWQMMEKVRTG